MLTVLNFLVRTMLTKQYSVSLVVFTLAAIVSTSSSAAGKCSAVRTESTFELVNAPVQEMQNSRNSTAINCVIIKDFIERSKSKTSGLNNQPRTSPANTSNGTYSPKTKDDNTPWRFDMNQNGKRMTSTEFDAWMKAKGISVATGKPGAVAVEQPQPVVECKPAKGKKC